MDLQIKLLAKRGSAQRRGEPKRKEGGKVFGFGVGAISMNVFRS